MSDSPMFDAISHHIEASRKPKGERKAFLIFPPAGPMESCVGFPLERFDCEGGHYRRDYFGDNVVGYEWVPE